jgi:hypothetical protein
MKEIFAGMVLVGLLVAALTSSSSDGQGTGARIPEHRNTWNDLRNPDDVPDIRGARFSRPRGRPVNFSSPDVLLEPAKRFAESLSAFAADLGEAAGPELGTSWLMAKAARFAVPEAPLAKPMPRTRAALSAPLPKPRPDGSGHEAQGVLSAALSLLEKAGLKALTPAPDNEAQDRAMADKAPPRTAATAGHGVNGADPARLLSASHPDRAPDQAI